MILLSACPSWPPDQPGHAGDHDGPAVAVTPRVGTRPTPAGLAEKHGVETLLDRVRQLPALIDTNPAEAHAIVLAAGSLLLLAPELKDIAGKLARLNSDIAPVAGDPDPAASSDGRAVSTEHGHVGSFHFDGFDVSCIDLNFRAFDLGLGAREVAGDSYGL